MSSWLAGCPCVGGCFLHACIYLVGRTPAAAAASLGVAAPCCCLPPDHCPPPAAATALESLSSAASVASSPARCAATNSTSSARERIASSRWPAQSQSHTHLTHSAGRPGGAAARWGLSIDRWDDDSLPPSLPWRCAILRSALLMALFHALACLNDLRTPGRQASWHTHTSTAQQQAEAQGTPAPVRRGGVLGAYVLARAVSSWYILTPISHATLQHTQRRPLQHRCHTHQPGSSTSRQPASQPSAMGGREGGRELLAGRVAPEDVPEGEQAAVLQRCGRGQPVAAGRC